MADTMPLRVSAGVGTGSGPPGASCGARVSRVTVPQTIPQALVFVAMLLPGFSYATVRTWFVGWRSPDNGAATRLLEALGVSAVFLVLYVGVAGVFAGGISRVEAWLIMAAEAYDPWAAGGILLLLLVVLPATTAWLASARSVSVQVQEHGRTKTVTALATRNRPIPRAWDMMAYSALTPRFVRIKTESGEFFGGWYGPDSYISTYPHERDIFIEAQWRLDLDGTFIGPVDDSLGCWVPLNSGCIVEWILPPTQPGHERQPEPRADHGFKVWLERCITGGNRSHG